MTYSFVSYLESVEGVGADNYFQIIPGIYNGGAYGCGDCCERIMNSERCKTRIVAADEGPWWIADQRYNEPNGNWESGCFLSQDWHGIPGASEIAAGAFIYFHDSNCPDSGPNYLCSTNFYASLRSPAPTATPIPTLAPSSTAPSVTLAPTRDTRAVGGWCLGGRDVEIESESLSSAAQCFDACAEQFVSSTCAAWCSGEGEPECGPKSCWCEEADSVTCMAQTSVWQALLSSSVERPPNCNGGISDWSTTVLSYSFDWHPGVGYCEGGEWEYESADSLEECWANCENEDEFATACVHWNPEEAACYCMGEWDVESDYCIQSRGGDWGVAVPRGTEFPGSCGEDEDDEDYYAYYYQDDYYAYYSGDLGEKCGFVNQGSLTIGETVTGDTTDACSVAGGDSNDHFFRVSLDEDTRLTCNGTNVMLSTCESEFDTVRFHCCRPRLPPTLMRARPIDVLS